MDLSIYITGASCSGVTTLGANLAATFGANHIDVDDFYWMPTDPPFSQKRPVNDRLRKLADALVDRPWVLSGSFDGWGDPLIADADLVVFLSAPAELRLQRLLVRERDRHGSRIDLGGDMRKIHTEFVDWASRYDDPKFEGRSRRRHELWLEQLDIPVLRLDGRLEPVQLVQQVLAALSEQPKGTSK